MWVLGTVVGLLVLATAFAAVYAGPSALRAARQGRTALIAGRDAFLARDADVARREFARAHDIFRSAETRLGSIALLPLRPLPVVGTHVRVGRSLSGIGARVAEAGRAASFAMRQFPDGELNLNDGRVDLAAVRRAIDAFGGSVAAAAGIDRELVGMPGEWVIGPLDRAREEALELLPTAVEGMQKGQTALVSMPSLFAETGRKRYLIAFSNLSELRGSGGFIGFVTVMRAQNGELDLEDVSGRPTDLFPPPGESEVRYPDWLAPDLRTQGGIFQNVNLTTDFPTVAKAVIQTARSAIGPIDGVIGVDQLGLSAVLEVTGPIQVPLWPEPIDAGNVTRVAGHDVYTRLQREAERDEFFSQLVRTTFDKLVSARLRFRPETFGTFDRAVRGGHFRMYSSGSDDQAAFAQLGLAGNVERARGATDVLSVASANAAGNKADWYLRRELSYRVQLDPGTREALGTLRVEMRNTAPSSGLPDYVIGSNAPGLGAGRNRQNVTIVRPPADELRSLLVGGDAVGPAQGAESSLRAYRATLEIPAGSSTELQMTSSVPTALTGTGTKRVYRLHVLPQPVVAPDFMEVEIEVPDGWKATGETRFSGDLSDDLVLEVHLEQTRRAWFVEKVFVEPWQLARNILGRIF